METFGERAVVLGASIGGLLAARVLADHYCDVTIVERDVLTDAPVPRRGVPQGRHGHVLLARSSQVLAELFPGFAADLAADGVPSLTPDRLSQMYLSVNGHQMVRIDAVPVADAVLHFPSRPLLERNVRRRIQALPNVTLVDGHDVAELTATEDGSRVTGVRVSDRAHATEHTIPADLVVDATGRGSRTPAFLDALGYARPPEDELVVKLTYASQLLHIPDGTLPEMFYAYFPAPGRPKTWTLVRYENDTWMMTLGSIVGHPAPATRDEMLAWGEGFVAEHALAAARAATPLTDVERYRVPSNRWRRYDKMRRFPPGLLVFGDAICSFNPIYGQGMTVAAVEAGLLRDCLRQGDRDLPQRFFRASATPLRLAWQTAVGSDLALPEVPGPRPLSMRLSNAYLDRVMRAAETDPVTAAQLMRVTGMLDSPLRLLRPAFVGRVTRVNGIGRGPRYEGNRGPRPLRSRTGTGQLRATRI